MIDAREGAFAVGGLAAEELVDRFGSPLFVYDVETIRARYRAIRRAFQDPRTRVHFAAVCNPNLQLLRVLREEGAGIHANTPGDVYCAIAAGFRGDEIVFSGSNVDEEDLRYLIDVGVHLNLDSLDDLRRAVSIAPSRPVGLRLHVEDALPESRMGLREDELDAALALARAARSPVVALHVYCGTHGRSLDRYLAALEGLLTHGDRLPDLACLNLGGGFGYDYRTRRGFPFDELAALVEPRVARWSGVRGRPLHLRVEPGRALVAPAGVLLTRVRSSKHAGSRRYVGLDTTVANFVSPAVHGAHRCVVSVARRPATAVPAELCGCTTYSRDVLAHDVALPEVEVGDLIAVLDAGAYGYSMSGRFLNRPRPPEVFVEAGQARLVTRRETMADLISLQP